MIPTIITLILIACVAWINYATRGMKDVNSNDMWW